MTPIADNLARVKDRIAAAAARAVRDPAGVSLIVVTKQRPAGDVLAVHAAGERRLGENRAQELRERAPAMPADIEWHFIGPVQTNKAKYLAGVASWVHGVDRLEAAEALSRACERADATMRVLLQVNVSGEASKAGVAPADAAALVRAVAALPRLSVEGLMTMAPNEDDPEATRPVFRALRGLAERLRAETGLALPHLSMGMTNDFEIAVEEGATMVRVGSAVFG